MKVGKVQVYTGDGKGKTTAAMGLALRAAGRGYRVFICQFMKGRDTGEAIAIRKYLSKSIDIFQCGGKGFVFSRDNPPKKEIERAKEALRKSRKMLLSGEYDVVILDEVNVAVYFNLLREEEVLDLISKRPKGVELILTGRMASEKTIEAADLVTEMKEIKHYYKDKIPAREGIEY